MAVTSQPRMVPATVKPHRITEMKMCSIHSHRHHSVLLLDAPAAHHQEGESPGGAGARPALLPSIGRRLQPGEDGSHQLAALPALAVIVLAEEIVGVLDSETV